MCSPRDSTITIRTGSTACASSGRALWARLTPAKGATAAPVRATPIALLSRKDWALWQALSDSSRSELELSHAATALAEYLRTHGASFFDDMVSGSGLLRAQAETGLGELVAAGLVNSDSFSGLRALLLPSDRKRRLAHGAGASRCSDSRMQVAGA